MTGHQGAGFGLYLHWPFCQSKCPYCDFNSHVAARVDEGRWLAAFESELARAGDETQGRVLQSVFFGGGTPSLMSPDLVDGILAAVRKAWPLANDIEITLEANPGSVEAGRFRAYRQAGVNRVSMGVQALDDAALRKLGRLHDLAEAEAAFAVARDCFDRVSFDLIYARQDQSLADWADELRRALGMAVDHLSLYQLTIEPGTAFGDRQARGGLKGLPDEDLAADMYELTQDLCGAAGMAAYEVSNHARAGAESRHNLTYWRGGDWVGLGPGAHGRLTLDGRRWATEAPKAPGAWLERVESEGTGESVRQPLEPAEAATEYMLMALRLTEGADLSRFAALGGVLPPGRVDGLEALGLLRAEDGQLCATPAGRMVLNSLLRDLLA